MITARLEKDTICTADWDGGEITIEGYAPVLDMCRWLVKHGAKSDESLEAYRDKTLCLKIKAIGEAAKFRVTDDKNGSLIFARIRNKVQLQPRTFV